MPRRLSVPLDADLENALGAIADGDESSMARAATRMIRNGLGIEALRLRGGEIVYRDPDGREKLLADEVQLDRILSHGADRAGAVAAQTMSVVRDRVGFLGRA